MQTTLHSLMSQAELKISSAYEDGFIEFVELHPELIHAKNVHGESLLQRCLWYDNRFDYAEWLVKRGSVKVIKKLNSEIIKELCLNYL
jgi:hypothetical protein